MTLKPADFDSDMEKSILNVRQKREEEKMTELLISPGGVDQNISGLPVDRDYLFSNHKNVYKKRVEKRQKNLLEKISFIKPFLNDDEKILFTTTGCSPMSILEQILTGWAVYYLKRSLFVFTNKHIYHIPTKFNYTYRNSIARILYSDCHKIEMKGSILVVSYKNGKKEKFYYMARTERKKIKESLKNISTEGERSKTAGRIHLCPRCTNTLIEDVYTCPSCRLEFKNKVEGRRLSIIYPGGGYFYTGHPWLGIGDAITELILLILVISAFIDSMNGGAGSIYLFVISSIILSLEKTLTVYHAGHFIKEHIPKEKKILPAIASR